MTEISVLASGSSANGYVVQTGNEAIVIECGCPLLDCEKIVDFTLEKIKGVLLSHCHADHARHAKEYARSALQVYSSKSTLDAIGVQGTPMQPLQAYRLGGFRVMPFLVQHDAPDPYGFLVDCTDGNRIVFATDTYYLKYTFTGVTCFMIECNYAEKVLARNVAQNLVHPVVARRTTKSHMSLSQCVKTLQANDLTKTTAIMLLHPSKDNSAQEQLTVDTVAKATGRMVYVAKKGFNLTLF